MQLGYSLENFYESDYNLIVRSIRIDLKKQLILEKSKKYAPKWIHTKCFIDKSQSIILAK
jgi:hypothetical protein